MPKLIKQYGNWMSSLPSMKLDTKSVELEKKISDFIPDIIVECGNMTVLVEIYVTHQVDDEKKAKIQKEGKYYVIEIDLSDKAYETVSDEELWNLINDETRIEWIYVPFFLDFYRNLGCFLAFDSTSRHVANCPQMFPTIDYCKRCNAYMGITDDSYVRCIRNNPEAIRLAKQLGFVLVDKTYDYPSFIEFNFRSVHSIVNRGALIDRIEEQQERRQYQSRNNKMPKFHNRKRWHRH